MDRFRRFGLYVVPEGAFYRTGAAWLGWDSVAGCTVKSPDLPGLPDRVAALTRTPRKYGFHGTVKPPFRLAAGTEAADLDAAARAFCGVRAPVVIPSLEVRQLGGFVAVVPAVPSDGLADLAAATVEALDAFRAPLTEDELARRRASGLTDRQDALLTRWGYPFVKEEFRFHLTLTGRLPATEAETVLDVLAAHFAPVLPAPFVIDSLCLMGEGEDGLFHLVHRYNLSG